VKISRLKIESYRSLSDADWLPGDLNVLIGPNASGKSNLLHALRLIAASAQGSLAKYVLSQGGMDALWFDGGRNGPISFTLTSTQSVKRAGLGEVCYNFGIDTVPGIGYSIGCETLTGTFLVSDGASYATPLIERSDSAQLQDLNGDEAKIKYEDLVSTETTLALAGSPTLGFPTIKRFQREVVSWLILDNLHTDRDAPVRRPAIARYEERLDPDGQNLVAVAHTLYSHHREFKQAVDEAMRAAFGDEYEELVFAPVADQRVQMAVRWAKLNRPQSSANLSDGTLRFLFLITALAHPNPPALIAIDGPEVGLHVGLLRVVAEYIEGAARRTQVVLTTHSPALLDAISEASPVVTLCEMQDGTTTLSSLAPGTLKRWLENHPLAELQSSSQLEEITPAPEAA
jgi:predicted ATPase